MTAVQSVVKARTNRELIAEVAKLYIKPDDLVLDATYGKGKWWAQMSEDPGYYHHASYLFATNDLDPLSPAEHHHDFRALPEEWANRFDVVAFDPPYVPKGGRETSGIREMDDRYGLYDAPKDPKSLWLFIGAGIRECARVLAPKGRLLVKCMDFISSGKYTDGLGNVHFAGALADLEYTDLFIHHSGTGPQPQTRSSRRQVHSRRSHSYLVVFAK